MVVYPPFSGLATTGPFSAFISAPSQTNPSTLGWQSLGSTTRGPGKARSARPISGIVHGGVERPCLQGRRLSCLVRVGLVLAGSCLVLSSVGLVYLGGAARLLLLRLACSGDHLLSWGGTVQASSHRGAGNFTPLFEHDSLPEWSKGVDSSSTSASCVGSNPTAVRLLAFALSPSRPLRGPSRRRRCPQRCELGAPFL